MQQATSYPSGQRSDSPRRHSTMNTRIGGLNWVCSADFFQSLNAPDGPDWLSLDGNPDATLVKENPIRRVFRMAFRGQQVYVKAFISESARDWLKQRFRNEPAKSEFENLQIAMNRRVPAPRPLAWASGKKQGQSIGVIITESLGDTISLEDVLWQSPPVEPGQSTYVFRATAELVARLHCAGIDHPDLHPGNILLAGIGEKGCKAYITDFQKIRIRQRQGHDSANPQKRWRIHNIAILFSALRKKTTIETQKEFLSSYLSAIDPYQTWTQDRVLAYFDDITLAADNFLHRLERSRDRRAMGNSRYAVRIQPGENWSGHCFLCVKHPTGPSAVAKMTFTKKIWIKVLSEPEQLVTDGEMIKQGSHSAVKRVQLEVGGQRLDTVVKVYRPRSNWQGFFRRFGRSRGVRQWLRAHYLVTRGIPTAWPLAAMEYRHLGRHDESLFISEYIDNACNLWQLMERGELPEAGPVRNRLADQLGELLGRLRRHRLKHRDCKVTNILVQRCEEPTDPFRLHFVDLDGVYRRWCVCRYTRHEAIERLGRSLIRRNDITVRDYYRTFRAYAHGLEDVSTDRIKRHELWRQLVRTLK